MNFGTDFTQLKRRISEPRRGLSNSAGMALGLIGLCFVTAAADDWPSVLGPRGDGTSEEKLSLPWPAEGPEILWWKALEEGYSSPIVAALAPRPWWMANGCSPTVSRAGFEPMR